MAHRFLLLLSSYALLGLSIAHAAPLACGVAQNGSCAAIDETWQFTLPSPAGVIIGFVGTGGGSPGTVQLYESDCSTPITGVNLGSGGDIDGETLAAGTYCLKVPCPSMGAGYLLELGVYDANGPQCDSLDLTCGGELASGSINGIASAPVEMFDSFSFRAAPGATVTLQVNDTGGAEFTPWVSVIGPNGVGFFTAHGAGTHSVPLPAGPGCATKYSVLVWNGDGTGSNSLHKTGSYQVSIVNCFLDGKACDDGDMCTVDDVCSGDTCSGSGYATCQAELAICQADLVAATADDDADGVRNVDDHCSGTAASAAVDTDGCSLAQFCASVSATTPTGQRTCKKLDWQNDEPSMRSRERDCVVNRMGAGSSDDVCVPATP